MCLKSSLAVIFYNQKLPSSPTAAINLFLTQVTVISFYSFPRKSAMPVKLFSQLRRCATFRFVYWNSVCRRRPPPANQRHSSASLSQVSNKGKATPFCRRRRHRPRQFTKPAHDENWSIYTACTNCRLNRTLTVQRAWFWLFKSDKNRTHGWYEYNRPLPTWYI